MNSSHTNQTEVSESSETSEEASFHCCSSGDQKKARWEAEGVIWDRHTWGEREGCPQRGEHEEGWNGEQGARRGTERDTQTGAREEPGETDRQTVKPSDSGVTLPLQ